MYPITIPLPPKATLLTSFDESFADQCMESPEEARMFSDGLHLDFRYWVPVTHETKKKVKSKIPQSDLDELGCQNPDIWVVSKTNDKIVLTPSQSALNNKKYRKTRHETSLSAEEILDKDWLSKINPLKFHEQWGSLMRIVAPDQELWKSLNKSLERRDFFGVIYLPRPRTLILMVRGRIRRRPAR